MAGVGESMQMTSSASTAGADDGAGGDNAAVAAVSAV
jgi:hypothetical protein